MISLRGFLESHPFFYCRIPDNAIYAFLDSTTWWCEIPIYEDEYGTVLCPTITLELVGDIVLARYELLCRCHQDEPFGAAPLPFSGREKDIETMKTELKGMGFEESLAESDATQAMQAFVQMLRDWMGDRASYIPGRFGSW